MGLPRSLAKEFDRKVSFWIEKSGPAWTVARLKSYKTDLIRQQGGLSLLQPYRKNRFGEIYGVIGGIFRFSQKGPKQFAIALNSLMAYSALKPGEPTEKHVQSLEENLNAEPVSVFSIPVSRKVRDVLESDQIPFMFYSGSPSKSSPLFNPQGHFKIADPKDPTGEKKKPDNSVIQSKHLAKEYRWLRGKANHAFVYEEHPEIYSKVLLGFMSPTHWSLEQVLPDLPSKSLKDQVRMFLDLGANRVDYSSFFLKTSEQVSAGRIVGLDKDGGWKIRWIANPHRLHQHALEPMKIRLLELLKQLPWDCTHEQSKAIPFIQQALQNGQVVHSLDLSSATDHFPLLFQEKILRQLNPQPLWQRYVDLFVSLSRGKWWLKNRWMSWKKGQPMGLGPSFPSFALAHGLLLEHLSNGHRGLFYVLGDDVVILDDELASCYLSVLRQWSVPVSVAKSIVSDKVAEFAGKVITSHHVFSGFKWKNVDDENFMIVMGLFGHRYRRMLTHRQQAVYLQLKSLQPPWGCNQGLSLKESIDATLKFVTENIDDLSSSTCWSFHRWFKEHNTLRKVVSWSWKTLRSLHAVFDEKIKAVLTRTLFPTLHSVEGIVPHVMSIGVDTDLPSLPGSKNSESFLQQLERMISFKPSAELTQFQQQPLLVKKFEVWRFVSVLRAVTQKK
jgi:hypothetical protein